MNRSLILRAILQSILLIAAAAGVSGQEAVTLFLKPDPSSYQVTTLPADDPRLADAADMQYNSNQDNLWKWVELRQTFVGHVRKSYITKGLTVQVGAPIYFVPGDEDAFLTILENGANAEVIEAAGDWVKVSVDATIPVYFETDTRAASFAEKPVMLDKKYNEPVALNNDFADNQPQTSYEVGSAVVYDDPIAYEPPDLGRSNPYPGEAIDRILEGKLVAYKPFLSNPWKKPTYQWEILNRKKKRIAFVDPRKLILDRPIDYYQGQQVSLAGSIFQINKGRDLVIVPNQLAVQ